MDLSSDRSANLSPDGSKIAYGSFGAETADIYVMNAAGTGTTQLTDDPADDMFPSWSPDGKHIAFAWDRDGDLDIYVMKADGSRNGRLHVYGRGRGCGHHQPDQDGRSEYD